MSGPIKECKAQLNLTKFEQKLQKEFERELTEGDHLELNIDISNHYKDKTYIALYGEYVFIGPPIIYVNLNDDYYSNEITILAKSMYDMLKNKLEELGLVIIKEIGTLESQYEQKEKLTLYLNVK